MYRSHSYSLHSSHFGHVTFVTLFLLIGFGIGYGVGVAYEAERAAGVAFDQVAGSLIKNTLNIFNPKVVDNQKTEQLYAKSELLVAFNHGVTLETARSILLQSGIKNAQELPSSKALGYQLLKIESRLDQEEALITTLKSSKDVQYVKKIY